MCTRGPRLARRPPQNPGTKQPQERHKTHPGRWVGSAKTARAWWAGTGARGMFLGTRRGTGLLAPFVARAHSLSPPKGPLFDAGKTLQKLLEKYGVARRKCPTRESAGVVAGVRSRGGGLGVSSVRLAVDTSHQHTAIQTASLQPAATRGDCQPQALWLKITACCCWLQPRRLTPTNPPFQLGNL